MVILIRMAIWRALLNRYFPNHIHTSVLISKLHSGFLHVSDEVKHAIETGKPIVALESTIITHGMRYPHNLKTALEVENVIRDQGVTPATIAVLKGKIKVGLCIDDLETLAKNQDDCLKISQRDIPFAVSKKLTGGTTVSATLLFAYKAGISIFVTGGIGGVHRDGENTMDISADLPQLGRTPVVVVSSGVKSILDIGKTLEYLETQGVAVATYGSSKDFPAFYTRKSEFSVPYCLETPKKAAEFVQALLDLNHKSGALIAVPVPEEFSLDENEIESAIQEGLQESTRMCIRGKDITPFLLEYISRVTKTKSLESNIALIKHNAMVGSRISVELSMLRASREKKLNVRCRSEKVRVESYQGESESDGESDSAFDSKEAVLSEVVVVGGSFVDYVVNVHDAELKPKAVFFSCIDSRMIPTRFTETDIGDMFVVRNAGNLIPHSRNYPDEITTTEPAALELGCVVNNVRHIIVCGHSDCKAMNLLYALRDERYSSQDNRRISPLKAWMFAHASSSLDKFNSLLKDGFHSPLLFEGETPQRQFVAYIDPENKFATEDKLSQMDGRTLSGEILQSGGGVARNLADALGKLRANPFFITAVGNDVAGSHIRDTIMHLNQSGILQLDAPTATCLVLCDHSGESRLQVGNSGINHQITTEHLRKYEDIVANSSLVVLDGNLLPETIVYLMDLCKANRVPVWFEPTDIVRASSAFLLGCNNYPHFVSPNFYELREIMRIVDPSLVFDIGLDDQKSIEVCTEQSLRLSQIVQNVIVTLGKKGVLVCRKGKKTEPFFKIASTRKAQYVQQNGSLSVTLYSPEEVLDGEVINASGAGDCFASGFIASMLAGETEEFCVQRGFKCSLASLRNSKAVPDSFNLK